MNALQKAQARLKALLVELDALEATETLTAETMTSIAAKQTEIEEVEAQIESFKKSEQMRARAAVSANAPASDRETTTRDNGGPALEPRVPAVPDVKMTPDQEVSIVAAATLKARYHNKPALKILQDEGYGIFAEKLMRSMKERAVTSTTGGVDVFLPDTISANIIEMLRPETTFFQGNPKRIQFTHGKFKAARGATGATASYVGEGAKKPVTEPTFDSIQMSSKKLAAIVLITEEARDWSLPNIDAYIRDDLRKAMSQAIDLNAYFGTGAGDSPTGILVQNVPTFDAADFFANPVAPTLEELDAMASRLILSLTLANIGASQTWAWLMSYRTLEFLKNVRTGDAGNGFYAFPELQLPQPRWKGFRVLVTNQVPINGGATTDETKIALIDFSHVLYGEEGGIVVKTSTEATVDVSGTLVHLWQQNMYGILTEHRHDFGLRYLDAAAVMDHVRFDTTIGVESP